MFDAGSAAVILTGIVVREPFQNYGRLIADAESHKEHRIALGARTDSAGFTKFNTELEGVQRNLRQTVASAKGSWDEIASATTRMTAATDRDLANMRRSLGLTADGYGRLGGASRGVADEVARANERMGAAARARARAENTAADESVRADKKVAAAAGGAGRAGGGGVSRTAVRDAENQAKQISDAYSKGFNRLANLGKWATAGIIGVGAISVKVAADFDRHMELVRTQAGASQQEVDKLKKSVLALAPAVGFGPSQLADGLFRIESHGIRGAQAIDTLKIAAEGAKIGMAGLDETSTALVGVMQSAPKDIKGTVGSLEQARNVMATLNDIVGRGNLHMKDLEAALGSGIVPAAKAVGLGLKDVGAALDVMTSRAIPAREGATRLRTVLSLIANPTNKAQKALDELGFAHDRLALDFRNKGLVGALQDLQNSMSNIFGRKLDPAERTKAMSDYAARLKDTGVSAKATHRALQQFGEQLDKNGEGAIHSSQLIAEAFGGARMGTTMQILMQNVDDVRHHFNLLNQDNAAAKFQQDWEATKKQFSVQASQMWAAVQVLGIKLGEVLIPKVKDLVNWLIEAGKWFGRHKVLLHDLEILFGTVLVAAIAAFFARLAKGIAGGIADIGRMGKALYDLPLRMTEAGRTMLAEQGKLQESINKTTAALERQGEVAGGVGAAGAEASMAGGGRGFSLGPLEGMISGIDGTMSPGSKVNPIAVFVVDPGGMGGGGGLLGPKGEKISSSGASNEVAVAENAVVKEAEGPAGRTLLSKIGSFATTALRGVMRGGMLAIGGMFLTDIISSQFHGGVQKAISNIGHDASIGAGLGAVFGPPGIAGGAIIGALVGTMRTFIRDHATEEGKQWADKFSGPLKGLLPAQVQQNLAANLQQHLTKAFSLKELMQQQLGEGGIDQSTWKKWFNEMYLAGKTAADQFERAFAGAKIRRTPNFIEAAQAELARLPPEARKWAALSMVQYAEQLVKQGKLPKTALGQIMSALEGRFKELVPFFRSHAAATASVVAQQFHFKEAQNNVIGWISGLRKQFLLLNVDGNVTGKNWGKNYRTTMKDLVAFSKSNDPQIARPALAAIKLLKVQGGQLMDAISGQIKSQIPAMAADINNKIPGSIKNAITSFGAFKSNLDQLVIAKIITARQRAQLLTGAMDDLLRRFKDPVKRLEFKLIMDPIQGLNSIFKDLATALNTAIKTVLNPGPLIHKAATALSNLNPLNLLPHKAAGGPVTDATHRGFLHGVVPGSPHKDGTLAMLSGREFVLTGDGQSIMERMAPGLLGYIEQHQKKHFQGGGPVTQGALARGTGRTSAAVSVHVDDSMQRDIKSTGTKAMTELANAIKNGARKVQDEAKKPASAVEKLFNDNIKTKVPQLAKQGMDIVDKRFHDVKYDDYTKQTTDTVTKAWNKLKTDTTQITKDTTTKVDKNWKDLRDNVVNKYAPDMTKTIHTESDKQQKKVTDSTQKAKNDGSSNWQKLADNTGKRFDDMSSHVDKKSQAMLTSVKDKTSDADKQGQSNIDKLETAIYGAIDAGVNVTSSGIGKIANDLNAGLHVFGGGKVSVPKLDNSVGHNPLHHESGGILPGREFGLKDNLTLVDPLGRPRARMAGDEAVFTRQQQPYVDKGLRAIGIGGMHGLWNKVKTQHSAGVEPRIPGHEMGGKLVELATGGYVFPFPKNEGFSWARVDQGQDLQGPPGGPILAIAPGVVSKASDRFSGFGPFYPTEQITAGPLSGRGVYYGHTKIDRTGHVNAGDVIAHAQSRADEWTQAPAGWLEIGFLPYGSMSAGNAIAPIMHELAAGHRVTGAFGSPAAWTDIKAPGVKGTGGVADSVRAVLKKATDAANKYGQKKANMANLNGFTGGGNNAQNEALGHRMMLAAGWPESQWPDLQALWTQESNWQTTNTNPSSGAYGIPQSLPASKMASAGPDWRTNPATQIKWGLNYIRSTYGSPSGAEAHERSHNWYDQGGLLAAGDMSDSKPPRPDVIDAFNKQVMKYWGELGAHNYLPHGAHTPRSEIDKMGLGGDPTRAYTEGPVGNKTMHFPWAFVNMAQTAGRPSNYNWARQAIIHEMAHTMQSGQTYRSIKPYVEGGAQAWAKERAPEILHNYQNPTAYSRYTDYVNTVLKDKGWGWVNKGQFIHGHRPRGHGQGGLLDLIPELAAGGWINTWGTVDNFSGGPMASGHAPSWHGGKTFAELNITPRRHPVLGELLGMNGPLPFGFSIDIKRGGHEVDDVLKIDTGHGQPSTKYTTDVELPAARKLGWGLNSSGPIQVRRHGGASQADANRLKKKPKKGPPKPTPLPSLNTPPGFDPNIINALTADAALVEQLRGWQGYLTSKNSSGPQLTPLVEGQDDQGNTTYTINWDGMADPSTDAPLKGINARLAEIGVNPGADPPPAEMINRRDYTTELGIENMIIDALVKEQRDAVGANATFWTWLASMQARGDLAASAPGGPDLDTKQMNWLTDALKLELPVEKMGDMFKDLGSMTIGTKTVLDWGHWLYGHINYPIGRHKVTVTKPWSTVIVEKMKDYRDAAARVQRLQALKDLIPRERRKRLENIAADYRRRTASIRGSSLHRRFTAAEMEHWALSDIKRHRKEALARIPTHAPHDWKGTKKGWKDQEKVERQIVNEEFDADEARIQQHARSVGLQTQLDRAKALENARTQEHTEQEVVREKYEDKIHDFNSQIKSINTARDMGKKWLGDLKTAIGVDRDAVKADITDAKDLTQNLPDLVLGADGNPPMGSLALDLLTQRTIPTEPNLAGYTDPTVGEIFTLKGTHPPKPDKKDGQSAEDIAALALADFQAFQQSQAELFTQFGSNYVPRGGNPFSGSAGISPGFQFFGAAGSDLSGNTTTNSNTRTTNIEINNTFGGGPPDAHTWAATQKFSVGALLG